MIYLSPLAVIICTIILAIIAIVMTFKEDAIAGSFLSVLNKIFSNTK